MVGKMSLTRYATPISHRDGAKCELSQNAETITVITLARCCKDDDQSQWERAKFAPPPPIVTKIYTGDFVVDIYHSAKFYPDGIRGFVSVHARFRASKCLLGYFWFFISSTLHVCTDFYAKYVKRRVSRARMCLLRVAKPTFMFQTPFSQKLPLWGRFLLDFSTGNFRPKMALT